MGTPSPSTTPPEPPSHPHTSPESQSLLSSLDLIARSTAPLLFLMYGIGFIILGFHDAKYGVVQFSPFRARIFLVGFVFVVLVALAASARHFRYGYLAPLDTVIKDNEPSRQMHRESVLTAGFVFTAFVMSTILGMFLIRPGAEILAQNATHKGWRILVWIAAYALAFAIFSFINKTFTKKPGLAVFLSLVAFLALLGAGGLTSSSQPTTSLAFVIALVGWHSTWVKREGSALKFASDFRNWITVLLVSWIYIAQVFSNIPPRWGGGQLTPVQVFQNTPVSWSPSNPLDALLLDETDQGFYVLLSPTGKAFFVPRTNVSSILFGSKDDLPKKP